LLFGAFNANFVILILNYKENEKKSFAYGFVRNYARFLKLPVEEVMALFRREFDEDKVYKVLPKGFEEGKEFPVLKFRLGQTIIIAVIVVLFFIGYLLFQYRYAFINPSLDLLAPKNLSTISSSQVTIIGRTEPETAIYVEKDEVSVDQSGNFQKIVNVFPGKNTITIKAINKFSKETDETIQVDVKPGT